MPYTPKTWENKPSTASPINANNLNHMEGGIKTNDDNIIGAQNAILTLQGEMLQAQGDISALETLVDSIFPIDTESGNPTVITDAFGGSCKSLKLTLAPIQSGSGTPSPVNQRPISGRTQSVIERVTFNLYDATKATADTIVSAVNGTESTNANYNATDYIMVGGGTSYYIKITDVQASQRGMAWYDANKTFISGVSAKNGIYGVQVAPDNAVYMRVSVAKTDSTPCINVSSSRDGEYEAYNGTSITIPYGTTIYGGAVDVTGEGATSTHKMVDLGTLTYTMYQIAEGNLFRGVISDIKQVTTYFEANDNYCSAFLVVPTSQRANYTASQSVNNSAIDIIDNDYSDADTFKAAMSGIQLCYEAATPTSIALTSQNITLLHGDNVLTTDADSIEASYSADIALYIEKKIAEGISQGNRSLSKGGVSEEDPKEEEKKEEEVIEEPKKEETR